MSYHESTYSYQADASCEMAPPRLGHLAKAGRPVKDLFEWDEAQEAQAQVGSQKRPRGGGLGVSCNIGLPWLPTHRPAAFLAHPATSASCHPGTDSLSECHMAHVVACECFAGCCHCPGSWPQCCCRFFRTARLPISRPIVLPI